jgi:molecular chaperone Hsp33
MGDRLIRGTALDGKVRAIAADTRELVQELHRRHRTLAVASAALGRTATMGAIMGAMMKGDERLTIQVRGDGPLGKIVVDANARGEVRGYVDHPQIELPLKPNGKLDVAAAVGEGFIYVVKDLGLKEPYLGSTPIVSGEIAEDFTYYFAKSEQTPSAVALGVLVDVDYAIRAAGGFLIQLMPGLSDGAVSEIEAQLARIRPVSAMLDEGMRPEDILREILPDFKLLEESAVVHRCSCTRERVEQTLISLGKEELAAMIREDGQAEVSCHFCNERYHFAREHLERLVANL